MPTVPMMNQSTARSLNTGTHSIHTPVVGSECCSGTIYADVVAGLSRAQKVLPSKYFYDALGSDLFEEITQLPVYYLTRAERELLEERMPELARLSRPRALVELGAGSAAKTRVILDALRSTGELEVYQPIDVSESALTEAAERIRGDYPGLEVRPLVADFSDRSQESDSLPSPRLYIFLGSTIGNLDYDAAVDLLRGVRSRLGPDDRFLLGVDLVKDPEVLEAAYNDPEGVTARFNLNILTVLNREVGTNFDLQGFEHRAIYNPGERRIEMHLVSTAHQRVSVPGSIEAVFAPGETIRTEISCKFDRDRINSLFGPAGLRLERWWPADSGLFALALAGPA